MKRVSRRLQRIIFGVTSLIGIVLGIRRLPFSSLPLSPSVQERAKANVPSGMVYIPGGECVIGSDDEDADDEDKPARRVFVASFAMDRTEVTNAQFQKFRPAHTFPKGEDSLPVTNVVYADAEAYSRWAGKRLPTEQEWEKAARGTDGRKYPWGNAWEPKKVTARAVKGQADTKPLLTRRPTNQCAIGTSRVRSVGSKPEGASPYGCVDMAGNAWEWVQGFYNGNPDQRLLRGGAVGYGERACRTYSRAIEGAAST